MLVAGLDACKAGWVGVALEHGRFRDAALFPTAATALQYWGTAEVVVIDIPIGLPGDGNVGYPRAADQRARAFLRQSGAASTLFVIPAAAVLRAATYAAAQSVMQASHGKGVSKQTLALAPKIIEVRELTQSEPRVLEGHPEVTFHKMGLRTSSPSTRRPSGKKTWNGLHERREALRRVGIDLAEDLGSAGEAGADDVTDAAAMAWTAWAVAVNRSGTFPDPPAEEDQHGRVVAIHFPS